MNRVFVVAVAGLQPARLTHTSESALTRVPGAGVSPLRACAPAWDSPAVTGPAAAPPSHVNRGPGGPVLFPWLVGERFYPETSRITAEDPGSPGLERFQPGEGHGRRRVRGQRAGAPV